MRFQGLRPLTRYILLGVLLLASGITLAQDHKTTNFWTSYGPEGGYIRALAIDATNPRTVYVGTSGGGVFKSINGGENWNAINNGFQVSFIEVSALVVDPLTPSTIYAATGGGGYVGLGVFRSTDGGQNWSTINNGLTDLTVYSLVIDPLTPSTLYVGTSEQGIFKTTNGGGSWGQVSSGLPNGPNTIFALAIDPLTPNTLYAGVFGIDNGIYKSNDGGANWSASNNGLPTPVNAAQALAIDPLNPSTLYANVSPWGIFKSTNGGANWSASNNGLQTDPQPYTLAIDPSNPSTLYVASWRGVFKSTNGGANWSAINSGLLPDGGQARSTFSPRPLAVDPRNPMNVYTGTDGPGVFKTTDGGAYWTPVNTGLTNTTVQDVAIDPTTPGTVYAGGFLGLAKSTDGGRNWSAATTGLPGAVTNVAIDPRSPNILYAGTVDGVFKSTNGGESWSAANNGLTITTVQALAIDPVTPSIIYVAGARPSRPPVFSGVFKSIDAASNWSLVRTGGSLAVAIDPKAPDTIYLVGPGVDKSIDGGRNWAEASTGLQGIVRTLAIDPQTSTTLYAGTDQGLYKSTDGSGYWSAVNLSLQNLSALAIDPLSPSILYAGGVSGVHRSTDGGVNWHAFNTGLTNTAVRALAIDPMSARTIYAATDGGGVFVYNQVATAIDTTPPVISGMPSAACMLWPPNHKLVQVAIVSAADAKSGIASGSFNVTGTSNESFDPKEPDIVITPNASGGFVVQLRAERSGNGQGRIYTVTASARDLAGNQATTTATCLVPHDRGK